MNRGFNSGIDVIPTYDPLGFVYGKGVYGPSVENRRLDDIRKSLLDPDCKGPDVVYSIAMDVGRSCDKTDLLKRNLLFGVVSYAKGQMGIEPVHSQGHIHAVSKFCGTSTCEIYEIWHGSAYIYMQETAEDDPGRCFAVLAEKGDIVIVPPGWAHSTVVADTSENLTFGAWCVRDYGFDYVGVRKHHGMAWMPVVKDGKTMFKQNPLYTKSQLEIVKPRCYEELGLEEGKPIYTQFIEYKDRFLFVPKPQLRKWEGFHP